MNIYYACVILNIWSTVKARAEIWNITKSYHDELLNDLKVIAKKSFLDLCMIHHPDKGGEHENYLIIKEAFDLIKNAKHKDFIEALNEEREFNTYYFNPGSSKCNNCRKWSNIVNSCITITCSGFDELVKNNKFTNIKGNKSQIMTEIGHADS